MSRPPFNHRPERPQFEPRPRFEGRPHSQQQSSPADNSQHPHHGPRHPNAGPRHPQHEPSWHDESQHQHPADNSRSDGPLWNRQEGNDHFPRPFGAGPLRQRGEFSHDDQEEQRHEPNSSRNIPTSVPSSQAKHGDLLRPGPSEGDTSVAGEAKEPSMVDKSVSDWEGAAPKGVSIHEEEVKEPLAASDGPAVAGEGPNVHGQRPLLGEPGQPQDSEKPDSDKGTDSQPATADKNDEHVPEEVTSDVGSSAAADASDAEPRPDADHDQPMHSQREDHGETYLPDRRVDDHMDAQPNERRQFDHGSEDQPPFSPRRERFQQGHFDMGERHFDQRPPQLDRHDRQPFGQERERADHGWPGYEREGSAFEREEPRPLERSSSPFSSAVVERNGATGHRPFDREPAFDAERHPFERDQPPFGREHGGAEWDRLVDQERPPFDQERPPFDRDGPPPFDRDGPPLVHERPLYEEGRELPPFDREPPPHHIRRDEGHFDRAFPPSHEHEHNLLDRPRSPLGQRPGLHFDHGRPDLFSDRPPLEAHDEFDRREQLPGPPHHHHHEMGPGNVDRGIPDGFFDLEDRPSRSARNRDDDHHHHHHERHHPGDRHEHSRMHSEWERPAEREHGHWRGDDHRHHHRDSPRRDRHDRYR